MARNKIMVAEGVSAKFLICPHVGRGAWSLPPLLARAWAGPEACCDSEDDECFEVELGKYLARKCYNKRYETPK